MATLKDIAKIAGVSHMTVSNVLNGRRTSTQPAAVERAERIRQIAAELGYRPHRAAQELRNGRTGLIAILSDALMLGSNGREEDLQMVTHLAERLGEVGIHATADLLWQEDQRYRVPGFQVDAAVICSPENPAEIENFRNAGLPLVVLNGEAGDLPDAVSVVFDDRAAMHRVVDRLVELGHEKIAFLNLPDYFPHYSLSEREAGYREAMARHDLPVLPGCTAGDLDPADYGTFLKDHVEIGGPPLACITFEQLLALPLYRAIERLGLKIPEHVACVSFNESFFGREALRPALSCITRAPEKTADRVFDLLNERLNTDQPFEPGQRVVLNEYLVERASLTG